jgi:hypothetical protein
MRNLKKKLSFKAVAVAIAIYGFYECIGNSCAHIRIELFQIKFPTNNLRFGRADMKKLPMVTDRSHSPAFVDDGA